MKKLSLDTKPKVIICDVDQTLTAHNTWLFVTETLGGDVGKHQQLYVDFQQKKISYDQAKVELMQMLEKVHGGQIHRSELAEIFFKVPLVAEVYATFHELKEMGFLVCLVSSSIDMFVENVANRLQINDWYANNHLVFDDKGNWIDIKYRPDEAQLKLEQVIELLNKLHVPDQKPIVIGDSEGDLLLFEKFKGVAMNSNNKALKKLAWKEVKFLPALIQVLQPLLSDSAA